MKKYYQISMLAILLSAFTFSQATAQLQVCIDNAKVDGKDFYFDISLQAESAADVAHLYDSDFVLSFAEGDFANPSLEKVTKSGSFSGYNTFVSNDFSSASDQATMMTVQKRYFDGTSTDVIGNKLIVNLSAPTSGSSIQGLNANMAKINHEIPYVLGRFKVSGLATQTPSVDWVNPGKGLRTGVFSINAGTFSAEPMDLTLCNNTRLVAEDLEQGNDITLFPNPLHSTSIFEYQLVEDSRVSLSIMDVSGRLVAEPIAGVNKPKGVHIFNFDAAKLPQGMYFYTLRIGEEVITKQMVIAR